ncbi:MAG: hypothetical protein QW751_00345 [Candidatus Aenigmatarchaeota archaeon]
MDYEALYQEPMKIHGGVIAAMILRDFILVLAIVLVAWQFYMIYPILSLATLFVGYFMLPGSYREDEPHKAASAWVRTILGLAIAIVFYFILQGTFDALIGSIVSILIFVPLFIVLGLFAKGKPWLSLGIYGSLIFFVLVGGGITLAIVNPAIALFLLTAAYYVNLPLKLQVEGGRKIEIYIFEKSTKPTGWAPGEQSKTMADALFLGLALAGAIPVIQMVLGPTTAALGWVLSLIFGLGIIMGYFAGPEGRPYIGLIILFLAIMAFSYQYTGVIGSSVFGAWWPQVNTAISTIGQPMGEVFSSVGQSLSDAKMLLTCPSCYYAEQERRKQEANAKLIEGGTVKAIEQTEFKAINYVEAVPNIDPTIPLIGSVKLENQGCFTARNIAVTFGQLKLIDPRNISVAHPDWGRVTLAFDACEFTSCTGADTGKNSGSTCEWKSERPNSPPGDVKSLTFQCGKKGDYNSGWANTMRICDCFAPVDTSEYPNLCEGDCKDAIGNCQSDCYVFKKRTCTDPTEVKTYCPDPGILIYSYADWTIILPLSYSFSYTSNVSMDNIEVMNKDVFNRKLLNNQIKLFNSESRYSGGPVKVGIYVQDQPLRSGEEAFGRISITNTGRGNVTGGTLKLWLPSTLTGITLDGIRNVGAPSGLSNCTDSIDTVGNILYKTVSCNINNLQPDKTATYAFRFTYTLEDLESKTLGFRGTVDYTYTAVSEIQLPMIKAPIGG